MSNDLVTVVINNCNLLTWPKAMVERIEKFGQLAQIVIVDNGSSYEPLLDWYENTPHEVIRLPNLGHTAPWHPKVKDAIKTDFYVVSDPDLDLSSTPTDSLPYLMDCLMRFRHFRKVGLGLSFDDVPPESRYYEHVNSFEARFWRLPLIGGRLRAAPVDTTFAIYHKTIAHEYFIGGARTDQPYAARHHPWSVVNADAEFEYYLSRVNNSSSYKNIVSQPRQSPRGSGAHDRAGTMEVEHRRNEKCYCGSGLRYKHCHGAR